MLETVKYSFVLPAYKAKFLKAAIDSIINQTYTDFELIIINDASPEDLDTIVAGYHDNRIRYYKNKQNIGGKDLVAQWNYSITYAKGKYIILASDDDEYSLQYLEKMDIMVNKYPTVNVFRPRVKRIDNYGNILHIEGFEGEYLSKIEYLYAWINKRLGSGIPFYIFNREALMAIGGFVSMPLAWFSDDATVLKLADAGIVIYNRTLFSFRLSNENISTAQNTKASLIEKYKATKMFYDEHTSFLNSYKPQDDEEEFLLQFTKKYFPRMIRKDKIRSQLKVSSLITILCTMKEGLKIDCLSIFNILKYCKYPIVNSIKRFFSFKKATQ